MNDVTVIEFDAVRVGRRVLAIEAQALDRLSESLGPKFVHAVELLYKAEGASVSTGGPAAAWARAALAAAVCCTGIWPNGPGDRAPTP